MSDSPQRAARRAPRAGAGSPSALSHATAQQRGQSIGRKAVADSPLHLDRLIHERLRLGIVSALAVNDQLTFFELKTLLQTTDGNLCVHARKLEEAEYITCQKSLEGGVSRTEYRITAAGRRALLKYVAHMEAILGAVKG